MLSGLVLLRLLLDDDRRGLLLLWRIDGPLVAGRDEWDPRTGPAAADAQKRGNRNGRDPNEFLLMRPGMRRLLDHDGGRLLLLIDHLSDRLDGLLRLVYHLRLDGLLLLVNDLPHGLLRLHDRGLDDHGRLWGPGLVGLLAVLLHLDGATVGLRIGVGDRLLLDSRLWPPVILIDRVDAGGDGAADAADR